MYSTRHKVRIFEKRPVPKNRPNLETNDLIRHILHAAFRYVCVYHHPFDVRAALRLNRDVAVSAVEDAARIKSPTVVCHALDCLLVLAGEGYARKADATIERKIPDVRHRFWNSHTSHRLAIIEYTVSDDRHTVWN